MSPQADSSHLETNPEGAREEPCRATHMTGPGVHSEWLFEIVCVNNILSTPSKHVGANQCKEWALRHLGVLLSVKTRISMTLSAYCICCTSTVLSTVWNHRHLSLHNDLSCQQPCSRTAPVEPPRCSASFALWVPSSVQKLECPTTGRRNETESESRLGLPELVAAMLTGSEA